MARRGAAEGDFLAIRLQALGDVVITLPWSSRRCGQLYIDSVTTEAVYTAARSRNSDVRLVFARSREPTSEERFP